MSESEKKRTELDNEDIKDILEFVSEKTYEENDNRNMKIYKPGLTRTKSEEELLLTGKFCPEESSVDDVDDSDELSSFNSDKSVSEDLSGELTEDILNDMSVKDLRILSSKKGLIKSGTKNMLIERLLK